MSRVLITGIGAVTPVGNTFRECWQAGVGGKSGIGPITRFDVSGLPWKVAGELKSFDASGFLSQKEILRTDPFVHYAVAAALMAVEDAGLPARSQSRQALLSSGGVLFGSSRGGICTIEEAAKGNLTRKPRLSAYLMPATTVGMASSFTAQKLGIRGPIIAGGTEAPLCRLCLTGYGTSGALSRKSDASASRPFERERDGFVLSEGACALMIENAESACAREANVYAEIVGYGNSTDAFHQTKPDSGGQMQAMRAAMDEAGLSSAGLDYLSAHGTSTPLGDRIETEAITNVMGNRLSSVAVSALKSITGHMLAASGALETAFAAMTVREGIVPPTINLDQKDPGCGLNLITDAVKIAPETALSNSFGFGGVNAVIAIRRFRG
jgi:3-oxoacyl-[acyl-carrier-protein] synthase II